MKSITTLELQKNSGYSSELFFDIKNCNLVRLQLLDGSARELSRPNLGRDFISGLLEDGKTLGHFRRSFLRSIEFALSEDVDLPKLSFTRRSVGELLLEHSFPRDIKYRFREDRASFQKCRVVGVVRGFIVTDYHLNPAIAIAALSAIEDSCE
jgi:hypothetical protein